MTKCCSVPSQARGVADVPLHQPTGKQALVFGIAAYSSSPLDNTLNDARDVHGALERMGFDATLVLDCSIEELYAAIDAFTNSLCPGGIALFYFAGHGVEHQGTNWLVCKEMPKDQHSLPLKAYDVQRLLSQMQDRPTRFNVLILDCCRNNPLPSKFRSHSGGLCQMEAPEGSMICFACAPKQMAIDGAGQRNGVFTHHLLEHLEVPNVRVQVSMGAAV